MAVGDAFPPPSKPGGAAADCVVGPPSRPPARLLALLRHVLARLCDPFTSLCVPLGSLRLGIVGGCFQMVLRRLEMRLGHRGALLEGGLGFPSGRFEMVLGLRECSSAASPSSVSASGERDGEPTLLVDNLRAAVPAPGSGVIKGRTTPVALQPVQHRRDHQLLRPLPARSRLGGSARSAGSASPLPLRGWV